MLWGKAEEDTKDIKGIERLNIGEIKAIKGLLP
jgi:hypothetical protein